MKQYIVYIEHQYNYKVKAIRVDQGKEYLTNDFRNWCAERGIKLEVTAPYSPSQNGVAERIN